MIFRQSPEHPQAADAHWEAFAGGEKIGSYSLWWRKAPQLPGEKTGVIGHYEAAESHALLRHACDQLRFHGCTVAIGPMDGNTWHNYRLITERGDEPPFFLELQHPPHWLETFRRAGFLPLAGYASAVAERLDVTDPRLERVEHRLQAQGVTFRALRPECFEEEMRHIFRVCLASFRSNFLFTPISESEFLELYLPLRDLVRPELVILAFAGEEPVGFVFAIPDFLEAQRGLSFSTVILKTLAALPGRKFAGLGNVLLARIHRQAKRLGFRRVIHALMHEGNASLNLSTRSASPFRRYTLFFRKL